MTAVDIEIDLTILESMDFSPSCTGHLGNECSNTAKWIVTKNICPCVNLLCNPCLQKTKANWLWLKHNSKTLMCVHCNDRWPVEMVKYHYSPMAD